MQLPNIDMSNTEMDERRCSYFSSMLIIMTHTHKELDLQKKKKTELCGNEESIFTKFPISADNSKMLMSFQERKNADRLMKQTVGAQMMGSFD